jgi:4-aminobutyrate aminotransferase-like enzyme
MSSGSYMTDLDGNTVLDLNVAQSGMPLGYNNMDVVIARMGNNYDAGST